jgi:hypothetical protein
MNNLFNHYTWGQYILIMILLLIAYYSYVAIRWFNPEIILILHRLTGHREAPEELPQVLQYEERTISSDFSMLAGAAAGKPSGPRYQRC